MRRRWRYSGNLTSKAEQEFSGITAFFMAVLLRPAHLPSLLLMVLRGTNKHQSAVCILSGAALLPSA